MSKALLTNRCLESIYLCTCEFKFNLKVLPAHIFQDLFDNVGVIGRNPFGKYRIRYLQANGLIAFQNPLNRSKPGLKTSHVNPPLYFIEKIFDGCAGELRMGRIRSSR